jgi:hypothetical protein
MTALSANRALDILGGIAPVLQFTILDAEKIWEGGILAVDYLGEIQMVTNTQGLKVIGVSKSEIDNTDDGEVVKTVVRGIVRMNNSATYPLTRASRGQIAYVEDDNVVAGYASAQISAGLVHDVDTNGVWVDMRPEALAMAWEMRPAIALAKTADYTVTAAIAFDGRTFIKCTKTGNLTITVPSAVAGMRVGLKRMSATAADDVTLQTATGDKAQGNDAISAAAKAVENTVDAISEVVWFRTNDSTLWQLDNPIPSDVTSWVKNDA